MLNEAELLLQGEFKLGYYLVEVARCLDTGWVASVPPLDALVTNYRLILAPQTRRRYEPASIPAVYILKIHEMQLGRRLGTIVSLKTGHQLPLFIGYGHAGDFAENIKTMLTTPAGSGFKPNPAQNDLQRLIHFIQSL